MNYDITWNTDMTNPQGVFDKVAAHLQSARRRSVQFENNICAYRGDDGAMCAVGVLVDGEDVPEGTMTQLLSFLPDIGYRVTNLLRRLQKTHDNPKNWCNRGFIGHADLTEIAFIHGLDYNQDLPV